ncbi:hypothetical protein Deiofobo_0333 [Pseudomonas phage Deifobo]|nr:hypothetical protein Deiofobo_0333 [Pseudomonas phage Deifobo]
MTDTNKIKKLAKLDEIDRLRAERDAALARVVELERGKVYVEARQCDECQHVGINDSATVVAACHECDWTGPEPEEDKCPGCQRENCMAAACPQCGARYVLVASEEIAAPVAQAQHSVPEEWHCMLANLQWHYEPYDDHYHRDQGFYCPVCGGEKDEGHKQGCNLAKLIATADLKEDKK